MEFLKEREFTASMPRWFMNRVCRFGFWLWRDNHTAIWSCAASILYALDRVNLPGRMGYKRHRKVLTVPWDVQQDTTPERG